MNKESRLEIIIGLLALISIVIIVIIEMVERAKLCNAAGELYLVVKGIAVLEVFVSYLLKAREYVFRRLGEHLAVALPFFRLALPFLRAAWASLWLARLYLRLAWPFLRRSRIARNPASQSRAASLPPTSTFLFGSSHPLLCNGHNAPSEALKKRVTVPSSDRPARFRFRKSATVT